MFMMINMVIVDICHCDDELVEKVGLTLGGLPPVRLVDLTSILRRDLEHQG